MTLMIFWGRTADRIGRKPVLVFSLAGVSIATAFFGLSRSVWQMILFRCCAGVFAGSIVFVLLPVVYAIRTDILKDNSNHDFRNQHSQDPS